MNLSDADKQRRSQYAMRWRKKNDERLLPRFLNLLLATNGGVVTYELLNWELFPGTHKADSRLRLKYLATLAKKEGWQVTNWRNIGYSVIAIIA